MKLPHLFASCVLWLPLQLLAAQTDAPDCRAPITQADMNRCAYEDFLVANGAQAAVLQDITQGLPAADKKRFRAAQKTWIAWRTAQCAFEAGGSAGGSAHEFVLWGCNSKLTRERTLVLEKLIHCPEGDIACPSREP